MGKTKKKYKLLLDEVANYYCPKAMLRVECVNCGDCHECWDEYLEKKAKEKSNEQQA